MTVVTANHPNGRRARCGECRVSRALTPTKHARPAPMAPGREESGGAPPAPPGVSPDAALLSALLESPGATAGELAALAGVSAGEALLALAWLEASGVVEYLGEKHD